jgi:RNA polymerase sigma-70 factor, ECF subfamily
VTSDDVRQVIADAHRREWAYVLAATARVAGDLDLAEECVQDAYVAALDAWVRQGVPDNPAAWLTTAARNRALDAHRRDRTLRGKLPLLIEPVLIEPAPAEEDPPEIPDDRLRLVFTCCHPALSPDAQVAMTLREVCGLTTEAVAQAFLTPAPTLAQRIVRAKAKIRAARIPYAVPEADELPARLESVLRVIYLVFNEGYSASSGDVVTRVDLSAEAIRLARLLVALLPEPEAIGLLALMLLHESRRAARATPGGDVVLLDAQDRSRWDRALIDEGTKLLGDALASRRIGPYTLQAAIAGVHANAARSEDTDWHEIVALYDLLARVEPSPIVELNRAVAVAMRDGPHAGIALVDAILARGELRDYHLIHAARADLARRAGDVAAARESYERALALTKQQPERRFLARRLAELAPGGDAS